MNIRSIVCILGFTVVGFSGFGQDVSVDRGTPIEWGNAYRRIFVTVSSMKKPGLMQLPLEVKVLSVKNLATGDTFYYTQLDGYDATSRSNKVASINEVELEEAIGFCKNLSEFVKETKLQYYTEYKYQSKDRDFETGIFWTVKDSAWNFYIKLDPIARLESTFMYGIEFIPNLYSALLNSKAVIARLKSENK